MELRRDEGSQSELASVRIYAPSSERKIFVISVFVALYAIAVSYCIGTSGDAHEDALERIRKRNRENFAPNKTDTKELLPDDPLPTEWAPASWAGILMGTVVTLHILFHLMCYWRPAFHAWSLHSVARKVRHGCRALATPLEYRGSAAMVEVKMSDLTDLCGFEFQRLRYEVVVAPREGDDDTQLDDDEPDMVKRVACPTEKQLKHYASKRGHDFDDVELLEEQFGKNMLTVPIPSFAVLYREQILSPLVIFQLFLSILWAMDDYLSYTLMQFCFILMFESTTVFQRQRTMKMLNGMTVKPFDVKVYRNREWLQVTTSDLLPGDLMQLTADRPGAQAPSSEVVPSQGSEATGAQPTPAKPPDANAGVAVVPCDCLLLRGEVVVNEASLTGESVPQMKEALLLEDLERALDAEGEDMIHVLASGTSPMSTKPGEVVKTGLAVGLPETPDGGCLCYVLRTGFSSSQGKLLQMIEFSTDRKAVKADEKEMTYALLVLLCFALLASGYVFKKGMEKGDKTPYELLLKCVIIISSVVPRSLPMTMAVAVNTALMTLLRAGVFCTEPHRVPFAGKLTNCLFDKTGTITTDTLSLEGIVNSGDGKTAKGDEAAIVIRIPGCEFGLEPVKSASAAASLVLGACHSLVSVEGKGLMGDPIEISGLRAAGWTYDADKAVASPCEAEAAITAVAAAKNEVAKMEERLKTFSAIRAITEAENKEKADKEALLQKAEAALKIMEKKDKEHPVEGVHILQRYRFLSKLQRSCTVVKLKAREGKKTAGSLNTGRYVLVKGSPEMVGELLAKGAAPDWYHNRYRDLAENGYRVIALAYKPISDGADDDVPNRDEAERDLQFVGFIAFSCRVRTDSELVITALRESAHSIALITGDSPLTALHVARQTGFCKKEATALVLQVDDSTSDVSWAVAAGKQRGELRPFTAAGMKDLVEKDGLDLMVTEAAMRIAVEKDPDLWNQLENIRVFARMTPQGKTDVIRSLQKMERKVLMCGDGGNDMGALKQADVGLALMSGYGNMNADAEGEKKEAIEEENGESTAIVPVEQTLVKGAEDALNQQQKDLEKRSKAMQKEKQRLMAQKQSVLQAKQKDWLEEELRRREAAGLPVGVMGHAAAMKTVMSRFTQELMTERKELDKQFGNVYDKKAAEDPMKKMMAEMESGDAMSAASGMPVVRPGDASIAAAFTSRTPSVKNCIDIIRQGRCALLSALQQQQIVMLHCLINAYVLSALSLEGSRTSERQLMASSWLLNTASIAFSYARPCDKMHPVRPLKSLFNPAVFISMAGQAAIHLGCLVYATSMAREAMEPESEARGLGLAVGPSLVDITEFWKKQRLIRKGLMDKDEVDESELGMMELAMKQWESAFLPNLMNTVVFLVETSQQVAVLAVNYKGQPWMKGLVENRPLFLSVFALIGGMVVCAWEVVPEANQMIHLTPFPGDEFRIKLMILVFISIFGTFIWDRICVWYFAPDVFQAMWESACKTTFTDDVLPVFTDCGKIIVGFGLFSCGLPGWIALFFWYKNRKKEE